MHLGEFLAENGAITYKELLEALGVQYRSQQFAPCVAVEHGFLSSKESARILGIAMQKHGQLTEVTTDNFVKTALDENLITPSEAVKLRAKCNENRIAIGKLLLQSGALQESEVPALLRGFMAANSEPSQIS